MGGEEKGGIFKWKGRRKERFLPVGGAMPAEDYGAALFLGLPDDVLALISARLRPRDLCAVALCCRDLNAAVAASEKVWLAQCQLLGPLPVLPLWRRGVRSYRALCRFLAGVAPLLGIWVHQNPELGNVVCVVWGFLSVVGVRVIPQELGPLGLHAGPLLWAPVFEILGDANGASSRFFLHGRDGGEDCLYPGSVRSIDSSSNVLLLEVDARSKASIFPRKPLHLASAGSISAFSEPKDANFAKRCSRSNTTKISLSTAPPLQSPSSPTFTHLPFSDRRRLLELVASKVRLKVPPDFAAAPLFERASSFDDADRLADRWLELIDMFKLNGGWVDRKAADLVLGSAEYTTAESRVAMDLPLSPSTGKRRSFSSVAGYLKQFMARSSPSNSSSGNASSGCGKSKHAQLHEFLCTGDFIGLSLRATHMRLTSYRAWPNMHESKFALYKLPSQVPMTGREFAGVWGGTFGWPPGQRSEGKSGKALFFLLLSYEELEGHLVLIATKILEGTHYVLHPNGSAMFIAKMDEEASEPEAFPWETDGNSLQVEVKSSHSGEGIANGYGFRYPGSKPGTLFVLQNGLLAFVWKDSKSILGLQRVELQELLKKGEKVPVLPPIANFAYLTKSYSNVFTGFSSYSGHSSSSN